MRDPRRAERVLTPEERAWLYNSGQGRSYAEVNLPFPGAVTYGYGDANHDHAVTSLSNGNAYEYDPNGNMTKRVIGADTYLLSYDAENRLVEVRKNSISIAAFVYDADGKRVRSTLNGVTTTFVGSHYEITGSTVTKYYFAGATRVAMRVNGTLTYLFSDHLGSTSLTLDASGNTTSEIRYDAWGKVRYSSGTTPTDYTFTGQYSDSYINLLWYGSRHYDPELGRFIQPDSIVPTSVQGVQALDRYAYVNNAPTRYTDPTGHIGCDEDLKGHCINYGDRIIYVGGFQAGYQAKSLGQVAEETYTGGIGSTGPVSGVAPEVPVLPGQITPPNLDNPFPAIDGISIANDALTPFTPNNADVFIYLGYTNDYDGISIDSLYTHNKSDYKIYLSDVDFTAKDEFGNITQRYIYLQDTPTIRDSLNWLIKIEPGTSTNYSLYRTSANPNNIFTTDNATSVNINVTYYDPNSTMKYFLRNITLPVR